MKPPKSKRKSAMELALEEIELESARDSKNKKYFASVGCYSGSFRYDAIQEGLDIAAQILRKHMNAKKGKR